MKPILAAVAVVLALVVGGAPAIAGKRVTAGSVTLEPPTGWKLTKQPDGGAKLVNPGGDIVWRFFAAEPSTDLNAWFEDAWSSVTTAHTNVQASAPDSSPTKSGLDGRVVAGLMNDGSGTMHILVLAAVSDGKRLAPMLIEFANQDSLSHLGDLTAASESIKLVAKTAKPKQPFARGGWRYPISGKAPSALPAVAADPAPTTPAPASPAPVAPAVPAAPAPAAPATPAPAPAAPTANSPFPGTWSVGQSAYSAGYSVSYGSRLLQYDFAVDGTYRYHSEAWGGSFNSDWRYIVDEKGMWSVNGDQLTVTPKEVTGVVRDLQGNVKKKGGPTPEKVTYRFQTTYFSGLKETQLVLTPPKATDRDGAFASNPSFPGSYLMRSLANYQPAFRFAPAK